MQFLTKTIRVDYLFNEIFSSQYLAKKQNEKAIKAWKIAIKQKPTHRRAWTNMIILYDSIGEKDLALDAGRQALSHISDDSSINFNMGNILGKKKDFEQAEYHFRNAISKEPKNPVYHINLGELI